MLAMCSSSQAKVPESHDNDDHPELKLYVGEHTSGKKTSTKDVKPGKGPPPEPPVTCCMSGCAQCVWIQHGEALADYYGDGSESAIAEALKTIEDPFLRSFVEMEIKAHLRQKTK